MALPAAATNRIPRVRCATIASLSAWESSPPPQELLEATRLTPRSFMSATYSRQVIASAVVPLPLESRNLHARIETYPDGVVADRTDRAGDVRAVEVIVHRVPCVGDRIDPVAVVHVAVAVVVEPVIVALGRIHPHVGGEIDVVVIHTGVDDGDHYIGAAGGDVPGGECADVRSRGRRAAQLPGVIEVPLLREQRIVRGGSGAHNEVRLDVLDTRLMRELRRHHGRAHACRSDHVMKTGYRCEGSLYMESRGAEHARRVRLAGGRAELDQIFAGHDARRRSLEPPISGQCVGRFASLTRGRRSSGAVQWSVVVGGTSRQGGDERRTPPCSCRPARHGVILSLVRSCCCGRKPVGNHNYHHPRISSPPSRDPGPRHRVRSPRRAFPPAYHRTSLPYIFFECIIIRGLSMPRLSSNPMASRRVILPPHLS